MKYADILSDAVRAPSGDNCQPWRFEILKNCIKIFNVPERDTSLFNYQQRASYVAHGALLENLQISASANGYETNVELFPSDGERDLVADVHLTERPPANHQLQAAISARTSNRQVYNGKPIPAEIRAELLEPFEDSAHPLFLTSTNAEKSILADIIALNDRIIFEHPGLHSFLFDHVRWSAEEAEISCDGLDLRTLELAFPDSMMFPLLKSWGLVKFLNYVGISRIIGGNALKLARSAGAIGVIAMKSLGREDFVAAGRTLERVWLQSARLGLSFQMMTGITFLMASLEGGRTADLTSVQLKRISKAKEELKAVAGVGMGIMFRLGFSNQPSARSVRLPLAAVVSEVQDRC